MIFKNSILPPRQRPQRARALGWVPNLIAAEILIGAMRLRSQPIPWQKLSRTP